MMHPSRTRFRLVLLLSALLFLSLAAGVPTTWVPDRAIAQGDTLTVHDQSVDIDFPNSISFNLNVEAPAEIERLELRYQPVYSDESRAERPDFDTGSSVQASYDLDLRTRYLPPGVDIQYRWIIDLEDGRQVETEQQEFFYIDNRYDWQENTEGPVSIFHYAGGSQFGDLAMDVTSRTIERFGSDFDVQLDDPINIVIYGSVADFQEALPYNSPEWIGGFAEPGQNLIVAGIDPGDGATTEMGRMLTHEVIHLMVAQATENPYNGAPRWLDEGLAITYQEVQEQRFQRVLDLAVEEGRLIPVRALRSSFPSDPDLAIQSYAQSESIIEFLIDEFGYESVAAVLEVYRDGVSHEEAVQRGLGMSLDEIDEAWKAWLDYDGDRADGPGTDPMTPGALERAEDVLTRAGLMPVLVIGGMVVVVLGIIRMIRAVNLRDLDEDVDPEVEYYGQDAVSEPDMEDDGETPPQP